MVRVTHAVASHRKKKKIRKQAKGFFGDRKNHLRLTQEAVVRALAFSYIHRKQKKRTFRTLWIERISAAAKFNGISYSKFINGLKRARCELDRKVLAEMAISDPAGFTAVVSRAKSALA